jgi:hypothetical protein
MNRVGDSLHHTGSNAELVRALARDGVDYVLVGGLAMAWYCPDRRADDMDLLVDPSPENSARLAQALCALGLQGFSSAAFTRPGLQIPLKQYFYAELLTPRSEGPSYPDAVINAADAMLFDIGVRVASPAVLLRMKELAVATADAQREKHAADIERLKRFIAESHASQ